MTKIYFKCPAYHNGMENETKHKWKPACYEKNVNGNWVPAQGEQCSCCGKLR